MVGRGGGDRTHTPHLVGADKSQSTLKIPWKSPVTSYPPAAPEVCEFEATTGAGGIAAWEGEMIVAVVVVGKWESRGVGGISKLGGKVGCTFPPSVFSTTGAAKMRGLWSPLGISIWCVR
jgi:hypothetical protein